MPIEPPDPGVYPDLIDDLAGAGWHDNHIVMPGDTPRWLTVSGDTWILSGPGGYGIDKVSFERLQGGDASAKDGRFVFDGVTYTLHPSGTRALAVQV